MNNSHAMLIGALVATAITYALGAAAPTAQGINQLPQNVTVKEFPPQPSFCPPHPRDFVQIKESVPFMVPTGRTFVLSALGRNLSGEPVQPGVELMVDGEQRLRAAGKGLVPMVSVPTGLAVAAGSTVEVLGGGSASDDARAWGYLVDD